jgi:hypothetical protein
MSEQLPNEHQSKRKYVWPWYLLAFVVLWIALAIIWMSFEVRKTRRNRELNAPRSFLNLPNGTERGHSETVSKPGPRTFLSAAIDLLP